VHGAVRLFDGGFGHGVRGGVGIGEGDIADALPWSVELAT
jgi:hypothetical protein